MGETCPFPLAIYQNSQDENLSQEQQLLSSICPNHIPRWLPSLVPSSQQYLSLPRFHDLHFPLFSSSYLCVRNALVSQFGPKDPTQAMPTNELLHQGQAFGISLSFTLYSDRDLVRYKSNSSCKVLTRPFESKVSGSSNIILTSFSLNKSIIIIDKLWNCHFY